MPISAPDPLLDVTGLSTGYGKIRVLSGVDVAIAAGEVVALLGPNGAGKTTLLRALSGLLPWTGHVHFGGQDLSGFGPRDTVKCGLAHVVEGHRVFTQLSVLDNLLLSAYDLPRSERAARLDEVLALFPEIAAKRGERAEQRDNAPMQTLPLGAEIALTADGGCERHPALSLFPSSRAAVVRLIAVIRAGSRISVARITSCAIGAAAEEPCSPCSTTTAIA